MDFLQYKVYLNDIDDDCSVHGETTVGVNFKNELVVTYHYFNDECHRYDQKTTAVVDEDDTIILAQRLRVEVPELPEKLNEKFGSNAYYCNPDEAEAIFTNVLDYIIEVGLRFKLK